MVYDASIKDFLTPEVSALFRGVLAGQISSPPCSRGQISSQIDRSIRRFFRGFNLDDDEKRRLESISPEELVGMYDACADLTSEKGRNYLSMII